MLDLYRSLPYWKKSNIFNKNKISCTEKKHFRTLYVFPDTYANFRNFDVKCRIISTKALRVYGILKNIRRYPWNIFILMEFVLDRYCQELGASSLSAFYFVSRHVRCFKVDRHIGFSINFVSNLFFNWIIKLFGLSYI